MTAERLTIPVLLRRNGETYGPKDVIVTDERSISHTALDDESRALAGRLVGAGIGKGARVGLLLPNGVDWVVVASAVTRIGAVIVPLSTLLRPPELAAQLTVAGVTHLVLAPSFRGRSYLDDLDEVAPDLRRCTRHGRRHPRLPLLRKVWTLDDLPPERVGDDLVGALERAVRPADDLAVVFTSGSRGAPKGTVHTHGGGLGAVAAGLDARCVRADDRLYIPMPFFWTGGFCSGVLTVLVAGATLLTEAVPEPDGTLALLERERATLFRGWPDQAARLAAHPRFEAAELSSLRPGSLPAVLPVGLRPAPGARANLFGMTETFGPYCGARLDVDLPVAAQGSCGRPFDGIEVQIADPEPGGVGEVLVRGPNVLRAICGRTRDATFHADGWYPTGDLGRIDGDGYLWYQGRVDDMFKVKGATVYPTEVEGALRSLAGVRQAHVTDVVRDDADDAGDGARAVGAMVVSALTLDELVDGARARLSAFKVPTCWVVTDSADEVPMTATSKVDTAALRDLLQREGQRTDRGPVDGGGG